MNTKKKNGKNIFEELFEKNICFAVCAFSSHCVNKGLAMCSTDYAAIINRCDAELIESSITFYQTVNYEQIFERKLSPEDVEVLKKYQDRFVKVKHNEYGRVYELKGNSFKTSFENNRKNKNNSLTLTSK